MKKLSRFFLIAVFLFFGFLPLTSAAKETVNLYFFYGDGCPHCAKEEAFFKDISREYDNLIIHKYEVWKNKKNAELLLRIADRIGFSVQGVPFLVIGDETVSGYNDDETTGKKIRQIIDDHSVYGCNDVVAGMLDKGSQPGECVHDCDSGETECIHDCACSNDKFLSERKIEEKLKIPFLGTISIKSFSLPVLTFLIAATDGFNPCAMWVLLLLISMLLPMRDKKKRWALGIIFIFVSGAVYFIFLAAWLNLFKYLGYTNWLQNLIGVVAIVSGLYHLYDFWLNREGCRVSGGAKRRVIFTKIKKIINEDRFLATIIGVAALALVVNLVELFCSAGLPAVYTKVLIMSGLPRWQYYLYLFFYVFIFMLDDMVVFYIAMKTLGAKSFDSKYTRLAGLIGGIIILLLGILLIFKPGWIMFA